MGSMAQCIICRNSSDVAVRYKDVSDLIYPAVAGHFTVKECLRCRLLFLDPQPTDRELVPHYPESYGPYNSSYRSSRLRGFFTKEVARQFLGYGRPKWWRFILFPFYIRLAHVPRYKKEGRILEIGCASGSRLRLFCELGWDAVGIEMSDYAARIARERGGNVLRGRFEEIAVPENSFDVVYMSHVFEHLRDPHFVLEKIKKILRPGGELILITPNGDSMTARLFGRFWLLLTVPRHFFIYQKDNISKLLDQHSFAVEKVVYNDTVRNFFPSLALRLGKNLDAFSFFNRIVYVLDLFLDAFLQSFRIEDAIIVRARLRRPQ
jgi:SAM-dependent methyltransferase